MRLKDEMRSNFCLKKTSQIWPSQAESEIKLKRHQKPQLVYGFQIYRLLLPTFNNNQQCCSTIFKPCLIVLEFTSAYINSILKINNKKNNPIKKYLYIFQQLLFIEKYVSLFVLLSSVFHFMKVLIIFSYFFSFLYQKVKSSQGMLHFF